MKSRPSISLQRCVMIGLFLIVQICFGEFRKESDSIKVIKISSSEAIRFCWIKPGMV